MPQPLRIYKVAVPAPLYQFFDYLALESGPTAPLGARVRVPFGRREAVGVVVGVADTSDLPRSRLKPITELLDTEPLLPAALQKLLSWAAGYYHHPVG